MENRTPTTRVTTFFAHRRHRFSDFWFLIIQARLLLCAVVIGFAFARGTRQGASISSIIAGAGIYLALIVALGFFTRSTLRRKRIRALPALLDVAFISYLVFLTGGERSVWYLLYIFPILSVSRYLSYEGSVLLALLAASGYAIAALNVSGPMSLSSLIVKSLILIGISVVAGNLSRTRRLKEDDLLALFREIDNAIINNVELNRILKMIVEAAVKFTESSLGQMVVFGEQPSVATVKSDPKQPDWNVESFANSFHATVRETKRHVSVLRIRQKKRNGNVEETSSNTKAYRYMLSAYVDDASNMPRSALFVPLSLNNELLGIVSLYSKGSFHYAEIDAIKLKGLAPALGIALKHSSEIEKTQRLKLLHTIGEELKVEQDVEKIFKTVVKLAANQLGSEEAALFVSGINEKKEILIRKEAVWGPTKDIAIELKKFEPPYSPGVSYVGEIFSTKEPIHPPEVPADTLHYDKYAATLPSKQVRHYIGVPVTIGDQVLGVLRVINKKSPTYDVKTGNVELAEAGFETADVELMQTIASQVASAIRSAKFLEVNRYYKELVENSPDPIIVLNEKGLIKVFNRACETIWGWSAEEVVGKHVTEYYESKEHAKKIGLLLEDPVENPDHRIQDFTARIKARNGEIIPIALSAALLRDANGKKVGSIGVFKDLRATQKLQEEKAKAERLATIGKMAHSVGHDVKHDIATALNFLDVLDDRAQGDKQFREIYALVKESLGEAIYKFQNLLLVGRPKTSDKKIIGAADVFLWVEASLRRRAQSRDVELQITSPDATKILNADIVELRQVLFNLFDNSIDAIEARRSQSANPERGRIVCEASAADGALKINWSDNGCGISPEELNDVFNAFVTSKRTGSGLGLFIVKNIVESHDGNVDIQSEVGKGTTFTIVIPLLQEPLSSLNSALGEHLSETT